MSFTSEVFLKNSIHFSDVLVIPVCALTRQHDFFAFEIINVRVPIRNNAVAAVRCFATPSVADKVSTISWNSDRHHKSKVL
jgi:hypothetical protein